MEFNLKKFTEGLINSILASLIASLIFTFGQNFIENDLAINFESFVSSLKNNTFYLFWLGLFLLIFSLRFFIKKTIDKRQDPIDIYYIPRDYKGIVKQRYLGFYWEVVCDYKFKTFREPFNQSGHLDVNPDDVEQIDIGFVKGPFCPNDKREMRMSRTYWGFFKYKCSKCKYKKIMCKDKNTLGNEVSDEIESQFR